MDQSGIPTDPTRPVGLAVVIPALNAADRLASCLQAVVGMADE